MPYDILWSTDDTDANICGLTEGNYCVTVTDANGCQLIEVATVDNIPANFQASISKTADESCELEIIPPSDCECNGNIEILSVQYGGNSNVDITEQLVTMITAQRNFQANAQVISTEDTVTQTIINLR